MMNRTDIDLFIGIDPGTKTGIAVWERRHRSWHTISTVGATEAHEIVRRLSESHKIHLRIEDARMVRLPKKLQNKGREKGAGSIERDCALWEELCSRLQISVEFVSPLKAVRVPGGKWMESVPQKERKGNPKGKNCTGESFNRIIGYVGSTTNHARDAAMWVWNM